MKVVLQTTGNHEKLHSIAPIFFKQAHGIVYVYDTGDKKSFSNIQKLVHKVKDATLDKKSMLIGISSSDKKGSRQVSELEAQQKRQELNIELYHETEVCQGADDDGLKGQASINEAISNLVEQIVI